MTYSYMRLQWRNDVKHCQSCGDLYFAISQTQLLANIGNPYRLSLQAKIWVSTLSFVLIALNEIMGQKLGWSLQADSL